MRQNIQWALFGLLAFLLVPITWLLVAKWLGMTVAISGDTGGLIATIGGIMGAIFTAGGLVIALVSVYTQLTLEARLEERARRVVDEKSPELLKLAEKHVEAHMLFRSAQQALEAGNWESAQDQANQALLLHETLPEVYSTIGILMNNLAVGRFVKKMHYQSGPDIPTRQPSHSTVRGRPLTHQPEPDDLPNAAITWLTHAQEAREGSQTEIWEALALMYAYTMRYEDMMNALKQCDKLDTKYLNKLRQSPYLPILARGCGDNRDRLHDLGERLRMRLPASEEGVSKSIESLDFNPLQSFAELTWYVMGQPQRWPDDTLSAFPITVTFQAGKFEGQVTARAHYLELNQSGVFTHIPLAGDIEAPPISHLISQLAQRFLFICPANAF